jgi:hypothetical protein
MSSNPTTIEILVTPQGKTSVQTLGFRGSSCQEASRFLEEALGRRTAERRTAEFYQEQSAQEIQHEQH